MPLQRRKEVFIFQHLAREQNWRWEVVSEIAAKFLQLDWLFLSF